MDTQANPKTMKTVYTVVERTNGKSFWMRVGIGFVNNDGSINLKLDAVPVDGTLQVRDWEPYDVRRNGQSGQNGHANPNGDANGHVSGHAARDPIPSFG